MKNLNLWWCLSLLALCFTACSDEDDSKPVPPEKPVVKIEVNETLEQSATFTVTTQNALEFFWLCQSAADAAPDAQSLKENGTKETGAEVKKTVEGLTPGTDYKIYVLALGEEEQEARGEASFKTGAPTPTVQLTLYDAYETSAVVTVAPKDAQQCKWLCLPAADAAPDAAKVLAEGTEVDCSQDFASVTVEGLTPATDYKFYAAVEAYGNTNIAELAFTTKEEVIEADYDAVLTACKDILYGNGNHYLKLNDPDWVYEITFDLYADPAAEHLPAGTYPVADNTDAPVLSIGSSSIKVMEGGGQQSFKPASGELKVEENGGNYVLTMDIVLENGKKFHGVYEGTIEEETN